MIAAELGIGFTPSSDLPVTKAQGSEMILRLLGPPRRKVVMKDPPRFGDGVSWNIALPKDMDQQGANAKGGAQRAGRQWCTFECKALAKEFLLDGVIKLETRSLPWVSSKEPDSEKL